MNKFRVTVIPVEGDISLHKVEGDDGPNFTKFTISVLDVSISL